jgi:head-tail adaptor
VHQPDPRVDRLGRVSVNPRQLNKRLTILREEKRTAADGEVLSLGFTTRHANVPAKKQDVAGGEGQRGPLLEATVDATFTIRWLDDLLETDRLECDGQQFEITRALDLEGKNEWHTILATVTK